MQIRNYYEDNKDYAKFTEADLKPPIEPVSFEESLTKAFDYANNDTMSSFATAKKEADNRLEKEFVAVVGKTPDQIIVENNSVFDNFVRDLRGRGYAPIDDKINDALKIINDDGKYRGQLKSFTINPDERAYQIMQERDKASQKALYENQSTASKGGAFLGSTASILLDPVNAASMLLPGGVAKTIAGRVLAAIAIEAGVQAIQEPIIQYNRKQAGLDYGFDRATDNIISAGIGGGAFQGLGEFVVAGAKRVFKPKDKVFDYQTEQTIADINDSPSTSIATINSNLEKIKRIENGELITSYQFTPKGYEHNPKTEIINDKKIQTLTDNTVNINLGNNEKIPARFALVEADDVIPSNLDDGAVNSLYPPDLQPRDRSSLASQVQVNDIANNIDPDLLIHPSSASHGSPIIGDDFVVDSGNGRVMALRRAIENNNEGYANYKKALIDNGYDTTGFKKPILVRMRTDKLDNIARIKFTQKANQASVAKMSVSEQAFIDKNNIDNALLHLHSGGDITSAGNKHFVRNFIDKNVSANDTSDFITKSGQLSQNGKTRIEAALLAKALNNKKIVADYFETTDPDLKSILGALSDSAPELAYLNAHKNYGLNNNILEAIDIIKKSRKDNIPVSDLIKQVDLERGDVSPLTTEILRSMHRNDSFKNLAGRDKIASIMSDYARRVTENDFDSPDLLGQKLTAIDHLRGAIAASRGEKAPQIQLKEFMVKNNNPDINTDIPDDIFNKTISDVTDFITENPKIEMPPSKENILINGKEAEVDISKTAKEHFAELTDNDKSFDELKNCLT